MQRGAADGSLHEKREAENTQGLIGLFSRLSSSFILHPPVLLRFHRGEEEGGERYLRGSMVRFARVCLPREDF